MNVWGAQHNLDITILITFQTQSLSIDKMIKDKKSQRWGNKVPNKEASSRFNLPLALKILTTADINYVKYL